MTQDVALPSTRKGMEVGIAAPPPPGETGALVQWAYEARQAHLIAQSLIDSSFVPESLRKRPNDVTIALLAGHEMGLLPMATMRSIDVIYGTPGLRAIAMRGLLQSHGHSIQLVESDDQHCVMRGKRKGEDQWQISEWDMARATRLGLTGKDQWKKQPRTMLIARATGEVCRLVASDLLQAMPYNAEELGDDALEPSSAPRATMQDLGSQGQPATDPPDASPSTSPSQGSPSAQTPADDPAPPATAAASSSRQRTPAREKPATKAQLTKIHILAGELGLSTKDGEREEFDAMVTEAAARTEPVTSTKDLNQEEAGWVIEIFTKRVESAPKGGELAEPVRHADEQPVDQGGETPQPRENPEVVEATVDPDPVPGGDADYWAKLIQGASTRGYNEAQIRRALEDLHHQPADDLTRENLQEFTMKVAIGTAQIPTLEELEQGVKD